MARNWREIRAEAVAKGRVDTVRADASRREMHDAIQAQRLAEIRKAQGRARQADVAAAMGVSQARVSKLESGDLSHTELRHAAVLRRRPRWKSADRRRVRRKRCGTNQLIQRTDRDAPLPGV